MRPVTTFSACRVNVEVVNACLQLHGGSGFMCGISIERMTRDSRMQTIGGGLNHLHHGAGLALELGLQEFQTFTIGMRHRLLVITAQTEKGRVNREFRLTLRSHTLIRYTSVPKPDDLGIHEPSFAAVAAAFASD
jgi:Acyl-CoA dehydrogenase, C-terminal domain